MGVVRVVQTTTELVHAVRNFKDHDRATRSLYVYGHGDGGGGPTPGMIEQLRRLADLEGAPRVELEAASTFFDQAALVYLTFEGVGDLEAATKVGDQLVNSLEWK